MLLNLQNSRNQNNWKTGANINIYIPKERAKRGEYNGYNAETTTTTAAAETVKIRSKDKDKIFKILQKYRRHYANNWRQIWRHRINTIQYIYIIYATSRWTNPLGKKKGCKSVIQLLRSTKKTNLSPAKEFEATPILKNRKYPSNFELKAWKTYIFEL